VVPGQEVADGDLLGVVHAKDENGARVGVETLREAVRFGEPGERARDVRPLVSLRVRPDDAS
jgi:hypothetical protein